MLFTPPRVRGERAGERDGVRGFAVLFGVLGRCVVLLGVRGRCTVLLGVRGRCVVLPGVRGLDGLRLWLAAEGDRGLVRPLTLVVAGFSTATLAVLAGAGFTDALLPNSSFACLFFSCSFLSSSPFSFSAAAFASASTLALALLSASGLSRLGCALGVFDSFGGSLLGLGRTHESSLSKKEVLCGASASTLTAAPSFLGVAERESNAVTIVCVVSSSQHIHSG